MSATTGASEPPDRPIRRGRRRGLWFLLECAHYASAANRYQDVLPCAVCGVVRAVVRLES